jgi:hypothetical protein
MHNPGMIFGYARVSTAAQDETGQVGQLRAAGCEKVFREKITGTTADRPQLSKLIKAAAASSRGDRSSVTCPDARLVIRISRPRPIQSGLPALAGDPHHHLVEVPAITRPQTAPA